MNTSFSCIKLQRARFCAGFTVIELMIVLVIIGLLVRIAMPTYKEYVQRSKIAEATSTLASTRILLEQYYQDNRNYGSTASACGVTPSTGKYFSYSCNWGTGGSNQSYTITATGVSSQNMSGFTYTIDQANNQATTALPSGWGTVPATCWIVKAGNGC